MRDTRYVSAEDLKSMFTNHELRFTPWFQLICDTMLFEWWKHLEDGTLDKYKHEREIRRML